MSLIYQDSIENLFNTFPNLRIKHEEEGEYINNLPHLCYEIVFVPYIIRVFSLNNIEDKDKIINFLESMLNSKDEKVAELIIVSVLEPLLPERNILEDFKKFASIQIRRQVNSLDRFYGWGK